MTLLWCVTRGCFEPLNQYRKSQLERAYTEEWESSVLLRASCTTRPAALQGSALKIQADPVTDSHAGQYRYISPDLTWVFLGLFFRITSDSPVSPPFPPRWPTHWSPSKSVGITGISNSITRCLGILDRNISASAVKLGRPLLLSIKDQLNLKFWVCLYGRAQGTPCL